MAKNRKRQQNRSPNRRAGSEQDFLASYDASLYAHPSLSVDVALITAHENKLKAVLLERDQHPAQGKWALPGTFVGIKESLDAAAVRALEEKTGISGIFLEQLFTFGAVNRDPRTRVVTVAYYALVNAEQLLRYMDGEKGGLVGLNVPWKGEEGGPVQAHDSTGASLQIAFDHSEILGMVVQRLRGKLDYAPIGFELLPKKFTLRELQNIHETILGKRLNKDSFRRRLIASGLVAATGELEESVGHRPAELYRFKRKKGR